MHLITDPQDHFTAPKKNAVPIKLITASEFRSKGSQLDRETLAWAKTNGFSAKTGQSCLIPNSKGGVSAVLFGLGSGKGNNKAFAHAKLARTLPKGSYTIEANKADHELSQLAWAMGGYSYDKYRKRQHQTPQLAAKVSAEVNRQVEAVFLTRDLINTPANDMGPNALEAAFRKLARNHKAKVSVVKGEDLLSKNFSMVHAVGRASAEAPRVLDMTWGKAGHPKITLVGKGVTFDTGGLNIKPGSSMGLMKKDMGGAANVMGLAHMIMDRKLPVRLRLIVGAVENSISANAFRPSDVIQSRKGFSVEIGNTDAEGRLVLGDCLALGDEDKPEIMIDMATLTGAARVALGPDLPPLYSDDDRFSADVLASGFKLSDPLWRMPLWEPYQSMLSSRIADVSHITAGGFAGSVTAALFLSRFVSHAKTWAHLDVFGWVPSDKPWATVGGEAQGIRALYDVLQARYAK